MRCWLCGAEPVEVHLSYDREAPTVTYVRWPEGADHIHEERPPTPGELEQVGHEALSRIQREAMTP